MKQTGIKLLRSLHSRGVFFTVSRDILSIVMLIITYFCVSAENLTTHYIIAFDQSVGRYQVDYLSPKTLQTLDRILKDNNYNGTQDYISVVGYSIEMNKPSIERFTRPYRNVGGDEMIWKKLGNKKLSAFFPAWPIGQPIFDQHALPRASLQSLSKPYAVMETNLGQDSVLSADRTILLIVSDGIVNGTDDNYAQEWNRVATTSENYQGFNTLKKRVFSTMEKFNEEFKFIHTDLKYGKTTSNNISLSEDGIYKVTPYEVVAAERPSIHSVTDFPSPLPLQRIRGGFRLNLETASLNPKYIIRDIVISDMNGHNLGISKDGKFDIILQSKDVSPDDTLNVAMSLFLKDGLYDAAVISGENPRYSDGMQVRQIVRLQNEAKILGLIPLSDSFWWWFPNDIFTAVMVWDLIILLGLIALVALILYRWFIRIITYVPKNKNIKITKI